LSRGRYLKLAQAAPADNSFVRDDRCSGRRPPFSNSERITQRWLASGRRLLRPNRAATRQSGSPIGLLICGLSLRLGAEINSGCEREDILSTVSAWELGIESNRRSAENDAVREAKVAKAGRSRARMLPTKR